MFMITVSVVPQGLIKTLLVALKRKNKAFWVVWPEEVSHPGIKILARRLNDLLNIKMSLGFHS